MCGVVWCACVVASAAARLCGVRVRIQGHVSIHPPYTHTRTYTYILLLPVEGEEVKPPHDARDVGLARREGGGHLQDDHPEGSAERLAG